MTPQITVSFGVFSNDLQRPDMSAHFFKFPFQGKFGLRVRGDGVAEAEGRNRVFARGDVDALRVRVGGQKKAQRPAVLFRLDGKFLVNERSARMQQDGRGNGKSGGGGKACQTCRGQSGSSRGGLYDGAHVFLKCCV